MDSHRFIIASAERRRAAGNRSGSAGCATSSCAARGSTAIRAAGERAAGSTTRVSLWRTRGESAGERRPSG